MNKKTKFVLNGFLELNRKEQREFIKILNELPDIPNANIANFQEEFQREIVRMEIGPLSDPCPCCGK